MLGVLDGLVVCLVCALVCACCVLGMCLVCGWCLCAWCVPEGALGVPDVAPAVHDGVLGVLNMPQLLLESDSIMLDFIGFHSDGILMERSPVELDSMGWDSIGWNSKGFDWIGCK